MPPFGASVTLSCIFRFCSKNQLCGVTDKCLCGGMMHFVIFLITKGMGNLCIYIFVMAVGSRAGKDPKVVPWLI